MSVPSLTKGEKKSYFFFFFLSFEVRTRIFIGIYIWSECLSAFYGQKQSKKAAIIYSSLKLQKMSVGYLLERFMPKPRNLCPSSRCHLF